MDVTRKISTVWRTVATANGGDGERWRRRNGGYGERWLRGSVATAKRAQRSHPLPSGGRRQENLHRLANGGYGETVASANGGYGDRSRRRNALNVAIRCQAVDVARKTSTVWRTVATEKRWLRRNGGYGGTVASEKRAQRSHPLPSGGRRQENLHRLANGGYGERWRRGNGGYGGTVATGERWLRGNGGYGGTVASEKRVQRSHPLPSGGRHQENLHRLANGGYGETVATANVPKRVC